MIFPKSTVFQNDYVVKYQNSVTKWDGLPRVVTSFLKVDPRRLDNKRIELCSDHIHTKKCIGLQKVIVMIFVLWQYTCIAVSHIQYLLNQFILPVVLACFLHKASAETSCSKIQQLQGSCYLCMGGGGSPILGSQEWCKILSLTLSPLSSHTAKITPHPLFVMQYQIFTPIPLCKLPIYMYIIMTFVL